MLLRSQTSSQEYLCLKQMLSDAGIYEEGMSLDEMRDFATAIHRSAMDADNDTDNNDDGDNDENETTSILQESIVEQLDPLEPNTDGILNSTVVEQQPVSQAYSLRPMRRNMSPLSSPEPNMPTSVLVVSAEVHHAADWNPEHNSEELLRLQRKRKSDEQSTVMSASSSDSSSSSDTSSLSSSSTSSLSSDNEWSGPPAPKRALHMNASDSGCSSQNGSNSDGTSISIHSSLMGSSEPEERWEENPEIENMEQPENIQNPVWYVHHNDYDTVMNFVRNKENFIPVSSSENIDFDRDNLSEFSN